MDAELTPPASKTRHGTKGDEIFSSLTHGVPLLVAMGFIIWALADHRIAGWGLPVFCVYSGSLIFVYLASTLYHSLAFTPAKTVFQILDHSAIYVLIAGTYTAIVPAVTGGWKATGILVLIWGCAVGGITLGAVFYRHQSRTVTGVKLTTYLAMGWVGLALLTDFPPAALWLMLLGGVSYSAGAAFYGLKRLPFAHSYWHLTVAAGSALHFAAVILLLR